VPVPQRTARIEDEIWNPAQTRAQAEGGTLAAVMRAAVERYASGELTSQALPASQAAAPVTSQLQPASHPSALVVGAGEPSPGVACAGPQCWERNTSRYGLRRVPLCPACAAALEGQTYQREIPPGAARVIGGTAARRAGGTAG
jgi:hypothetical protein